MELLFIEDRAETLKANRILPIPLLLIIGVQLQLRIKGGCPANSTVFV